MIELELASKAVAKQDKRSKDAFGYAATTGGKRITTKYLPAVIKQITAKFATVSKQGTADYELEFMLRKLDKEVIALVCLQGVLMATAKHDRYHTKVLSTVGKDLEDELYYQGLLQSDKKAAHRLGKMVAVKYGTSSQRRSAVRAMASTDYVNKAGKLVFRAYQQEEWTEDKRVEAGKWCFNVVMSALPGVFRWEVRDGLRYPTLCDSAVAEAAAAVRELATLRPVWQPRATCPPQWDGWTIKPSEDPKVRPINLVKTYHKETEIAVRGAIASGQAAPALKGLNALQSVPYKINTWVLDVVKASGGTRVLPSTSKVEPNANVHMNETLKLSRKHKANYTRLAADLATADRCVEQGVFYVPMQFEWRTRVNSVPMFNFQREDHIRALFLFHEGKPITQKGIHWLQIHIANCADFDKVSKQGFPARLAWTAANMRFILAAAADPIKDPEFIGPTMGEIWQYADCPFLFLAACKELSDCNGNPDYISHLPGAWDGACNGLQHLAAMTRGLEEGRNVNLTDNAEPLDIYQLVADKVRLMVADDQIRCNMANDPKIELDRKYSNMLAAFGVNRKLVKRCVMTFCYGSKEFGMGNHIITDTMDAEHARVIQGEIDKHPFGEPSEQRGAARYIAAKTYDAIMQVVSGPAEAMKLFQDCAAKLAHEYKVLSWVTPAGMPLVNRYHERQTTEVRLWLHDRGVTDMLRAKVAIGNTPKVDRVRVKNGAAPNIVHACDASHLLLTAGACADEGIQLATVHDSYATRLCDTDRMLEILKGEFVRMYQEHDVLAEVLASAAADFTGDKRRQLPPLPEKGTLDLNEVKQARYAFA